MSLPPFMTLPTIRAGTPVVIASAIVAAYSPLRSMSNASPASSRRFVSAYSSRLPATRSRYSPIGMLKRSIASPDASRLPMNHGLYSAWCSDDSVR